MHNTKAIIQRNYIPGDQWLYYQIFTGPKTADLILTDIIWPIVSHLLNEKIIDKWFFIRYSDPHYHLRIRFQFKNQENLPKIIYSINSSLNELISQDLIWKVQLATYERELERYGHYNIINSENLFFHDSHMVINFLEIIKEIDEENLRWLFALKSIDTLIGTFNFSVHEKLNLMKNLKTNFGNEFGMNRQLKKQLDEKYRYHRKIIDDFLQSKTLEELNYSSINEVITKRNVDLKPVVEAILLTKKENLLDMELYTLLGSYIHMSMNRLFTSKNRLNEMVCYDFLYRSYKSSIAKKEKMISA